MKKCLSLIAVGLFMMICCCTQAHAYGSERIIVGSARTLYDAAKSAVGGECIVLRNDIDISADIFINESMELDLNGHTIRFLNHSSILVGSVESKVEYEKKYIYGHYEDINGERKWVSGRYVTESKRVDVPKDITVRIANGTIIGKDGADGKSAKWVKSGHDGSPALIMRSGKLKLKDIVAYGGDGGNGKDGSWEIGRSAGNGGDGASAIRINRAEKFVADNCTFYGGKGGISGKKDNTGWTSIFCFSGRDGYDARGLLYYSWEVKDVQIIY